MDKPDAIQALHAGKTVILTVGPAPDDPVIKVWIDNGMVMSEAIAGWSAGVVEAVCEAGSDFLDTYYFHERHKLELAETVIVRVRSHRARGKLQAIVGGAGVAMFSFQREGEFWRIPAEHLPAARKITGVTQSRGSHGDLMKCWDR